jgi:hypothetical protein
LEALASTPDKENKIGIGIYLVIIHAVRYLKCGKSCMRYLLHLPTLMVTDVVILMARFSTKDFVLFRWKQCQHLRSKMVVMTVLVAQKPAAAMAV